MKKSGKPLLIAGFLVVLSVASTGASSPHVVKDGWASDRVGMPEEEYWEVIITRHGFPLGWYAVIIYMVGDHIESVTTEFRSGVFIVDTIVYFIAYSLICLIAYPLMSNPIACTRVSQGEAEGTDRDGCMTD